MEIGERRREEKSERGREGREGRGRDSRVRREKGGGEGEEKKGGREKGGSALFRYHSRGDETVVCKLKIQGMANVPLTLLNRTLGERGGTCIHAQQGKCQS